MDLDMQHNAASTLQSMDDGHWQQPRKRPSAPSRRTDVADLPTAVVAFVAIMALLWWVGSRALQLAIDMGADWPMYAFGALVILMIAGSFIALHRSRQRILQGAEQRWHAALSGLAAASTVFGVLAAWILIVVDGLQDIS